MNQTTNTPLDPLEAFGLAILRVDTRYVILAAIGLVGLYCLALWVSKNRFMSQSDAVSLALALLQFYTAPVLLAMLVLTQPPAVDQVSTMQRQSAGALAFIFLIGGVLQQIKKFWNG